MVSLLAHFANSSSWFDTWENEIISSRLVFSLEIFLNKRPKTLLIQDWPLPVSIVTTECAKNNTTKNSIQPKTVINLKDYYYNSSSTCCGFSILYPCWSKPAIFLPSIRGYGEPPENLGIQTNYVSRTYMQKKLPRLRPWSLIKKKKTTTYLQ